MTNINRRPPILVLGLLLALACELDSRQDAEALPPHSGDGEYGAERLSQFTLDVDMRIDGYDADLTPIGWVGVNAGRLAIVQPQDHKIRYFDASGASLYSFGSMGEGPGEFRRMGRAGWLADTLWVADTQLRRVTLISPAGKLVRTLPPLAFVKPLYRDSARLPILPRVQTLALYAGDTLLVAGYGAAGDPLAEALQGMPLLRVSRDGVIHQLIANIPPDLGTISTMTHGVLVTSAVPFFPGPLWAVSQDGGRIAVLTTNLAGEDAGTFRVATFDAAGAHIFSRRYPFQAVPLPIEVADSALSSQAERASRPEVRRAIEIEVAKRMPSIYPPVTALVVGTDYRVWIGFRPNHAGQHWLILDSYGDPVGTTAVSRNVFVRLADSEHIWAVERDEMNVESVVRYRLTVKKGR